MLFIFFFFNDTATTEIYTLSLHDALPISGKVGRERPDRSSYLPAHSQMVHRGDCRRSINHRGASGRGRSEEHTSELQSRLHLVCRLLLEKKKKKKIRTDT